MNPFYKDYSEYIAEIFPDFKVQKLSVNTSRSCPNRDGTLGTGGCIYCNNRSFTPGYCFSGASVADQLRDGKRFFARKYPDMRYIAYFQSFSSTYGEGLRQDIEEAVSVDDVCGIAVGARPDCLGPDVIAILTEYARKMPVFVEIGVESLHDDTLKLINRGHDADTAVRAIRNCAEAGLHVGVHLIAGLPGETDEMILDTVRQVCDLPVGSLKMHQLQVLKDTPLAAMIEAGKVSVSGYSLEDYLTLCVRIVEAVPRHICIERFLAQAPSDMVLSPKWGIKNYEFTNLLLNSLSEATKIKLRINLCISFGSLQKKL